MMRLEPPVYKYCPFCGYALARRVEESRQHQYCPECNWTYYPYVAGSVTAVIRRNNYVLMVQRMRELFIGTWMFPSGFIEYGEHPQDTLNREVREETGLDVKEHRLLGIFQSDDDPRQLGHFVFVYETTVTGFALATDIEENSAVQWFDVYAPPVVKWKLHQHILHEIVNGRR